MLFAKNADSKYIEYICIAIAVDNFCVDNRTDTLLRLENIFSPPPIYNNAHKLLIMSYCMGD